MTFKNLEQRFNASVEKLYAGAKLKFEDGKPASGPFNDPILVRKPGDGQSGIKTEGRSLPFVSAPRDLKRLTLFQISKSGILFLAKQQLLQTGNTFEQTRLINPLFVIGNAIPFLHVRRHLKPLSGLLGKTDTSYTNVRKLGQLQKNTYDTAGKESKKGVGSLLKSLASPITNTVSAFTAKKNVGEEFGNWDEESWKKSRPELGESDKDYVVGVNPPAFRFGGTIETDTFVGSKYGAIPNSPGAWDGVYTNYYNFGGLDYSNSKILPVLEPVGEQQPTNTDTDTRTPELSEVGGENSLKTRFENASVIQKLRTDELERSRYLIDSYFNEVSGGDIPTQPYLKYFDPGPADDPQPVSISSIEKGGEKQDDGSITLNAKYLAQNRVDKTKRISYIKDPANKKYINLKADTAYSNLPGMGNTPEEKNFDDPVVVSFAMGNKNHIQFRAFITGLQQSATPEYTPLQYIGRVEKFINFKGIQRDVSFKLGIIAFSKDELDVVWSRINYLTGMVYPYGFNRGILQPNIIRLTIGNVYVDQPGYITSLGTNFSDLTESWDIDRQVPISAVLDVKFVIIEKATKIASSPFYGITEQNTDYFVKTLESPQPPGAAGDITSNEPAVVPATLGRSLDAGQLKLRTTLPTVNPETLPLPGVKNLKLPAPTIPSFNTNA